jgi:hypothetical protein
MNQTTLQQHVLRGNQSGQTPRELAMEEQAQAELSDSKYIGVRRLSCQVRGGVLTLNGRVRSFYLKQVAQTLLRRYLERGIILEDRLDVEYEKAG